MNVTLSEVQQLGVLVTPEDNPQGNKMCGAERRNRILLQLVF